MIRRLAIAAIACLPAGAFAGDMPCGPRDAVTAHLQDVYGESVVMRGLDGGGRMLEIWANPETGTWTATLVLPQGLTCIVSSGEALDLPPVPAPGQPT